MFEKWRESRKQDKLTKEQNKREKARVGLNDFLSKFNGERFVESLIDPTWSRDVGLTVADVLNKIPTNYKVVHMKQTLVYQDDAMRVYWPQILAENQDVKE